MYAPEQQLSMGVQAWIILRASVSILSIFLCVLYKNWSARKHVWSCNVLQVIFPISAFPVIHCHWRWQSLLVNDHNPHQVGKTGSLLLGPMCLLLSRELRPLWGEALTSCSDWSVTWQCQRCPWGLGFCAQCINSTHTLHKSVWRPRSPTVLKTAGIGVEPLWPGSFPKVLAALKLEGLSSTQGLVDLLQ